MSESENTSSHDILKISWFLVSISGKYRWWVINPQILDVFQNFLWSGVIVEATLKRLGVQVNHDFRGSIEVPASRVILRP
jgi:hypothetical protein